MIADYSLQFSVFFLRENKFLNPSLCPVREMSLVFSALLNLPVLCHDQLIMLHHIPKQS